jgi:hypothetical protein
MRGSSFDQYARSGTKLDHIIVHLDVKHAFQNVPGLVIFVVAV